MFSTIGLPVRYTIVFLLSCFYLNGFSAINNDTGDSTDQKDVIEPIQFHFSDGLSSSGAESYDQFIQKPTLGLGVGMFTFYGDIANNHKGFHPTVSRLGYQLRVAYPLNGFLDLQFHTIFGKISANERTPTRNLNFESRIRSGGLSLAYNFDHLLKPYPERKADPFVFVGIESFEFLSKTDRYDQFGNEYHYWSDGSIRNLPENDPNADNAIRIYRDYIYETDLREQNIDGKGKYPERSWAIPVGIGANFHMGEHFKFRIQTSMHFTFTDLVDDVTGESAGNRAGTDGNDKFLFTSFTMNYDLQRLGGEQEEKEVMPPDPWEENLFALDTFDRDNDLVVDFQDACPYTPKGVEVDEKGCPLDDDGDGVPNYRDEELDTPDGMYVNDKGIGLSDEMLARFFQMYKDTTGQFAPYDDSVMITVYPEGEQIFNSELAKKNRDKNQEYVIVLDKKKINVKANELYKYLGYREFETVSEGDTVYYVIKGFDDLASAVATQGDLAKKGIKTEGIGEKTEKGPGMDHVEYVDEKEIEEVKEQGGQIKELTGTEDITYRVQIAAYSKPVNNPKFNDLNNVVQFKGGDGLVRYYSGSYDNLNEASKHKIDVAYEHGFNDAFIVAFKNGKRISLNEVTKVKEGYDEGIEEYEQAMTKGIDESQIVYRVHLGSFKDGVPTDLLDLYLSLGNVQHQKDEEGVTHYLLGEFDSAGKAEQEKKKILDKGLTNVYVVGDYNGKLLSLEEIIELLENNESDE